MRNARLSKLDKYGWSDIRDFKKFSEEYKKVINGTEKPFDLMRQLDMKKSTFYKYATQYKKENNIK